MGLKTEFSQSNVNEDPEKNEDLPDKQRMKNIELDIVNQRNMMMKIIDQNNKYAEYLDREIEEKKGRQEFWKDVKKKLAVSGILGAIGIVISVGVYAAKQWINNQ